MTTIVITIQIRLIKYRFLNTFTTVLVKKLSDPSLATFSFLLVSQANIERHDQDYSIELDNL